MYVCMYVCMLACVSDFNFSAVRLDINSKADNIFCLVSEVSIQGKSDTATFLYRSFFLFHFCCYDTYM